MKSDLSEFVRVTPDDIWDYFVANSDRLRTTQIMVAENKNNGMELYITDDDGTAVFTIYNGDDPVFEHEAYSRFDIEDTYKMALSDIGIDYDNGFDDEDEDSGFPISDLLDRSLASYKEDEEESKEDTEEEFDIRVREAELNNAVQNLIYEILDNDLDEICGDEIEQATFTIKEAVCDILARQYHLPVYRPMYLVTASGERFFEEYPYPHIEEDNS